MGSERDDAYRIEGDRRFSATFPQSALPVPTRRAVKVESVSVKVDSRIDLEGRSERQKAGREAARCRAG